MKRKEKERRAEDQRKLDSQINESKKELSDAEAALEALKFDLIDEQKEKPAPVPVSAPIPVVLPTQPPAAVAQVPEPDVKIEAPPPVAPTSQEVPSLSASQELAPLFDANELKVDEPLPPKLSEQ